MALPLEGIKIVDMTQIVMGPTCTRNLADQGADVIKVEPFQGDDYRNRYTSSRLASHNLSRPFLTLNRNKRSIVVDLSKRNGRDVVYRLALSADVMVVSLRLMAAKRLLLDYATLGKMNPRLVYASISGYGRRGPDANLPAYDMALQARSGIASTSKNSDGAPIPSAILIADTSGAMFLSYAIMVALWERERTGYGQEVQMSLLSQALAMQDLDLVMVEGEPSDISSDAPRGATFYYRCSDDRYLSVITVTDRQWSALCDVIGLEHLVVDERFTSFDKRRTMAQEVFELLSGVFGTRPRDEWLRLLRGAEVPSSPVAYREEVFDDVQVVANEMFVRQYHPDLGKVTMVNVPFTFIGSEESRFRWPAPGLGQHTDEVLSELGYSQSDIAQLRREHIVG
ncbi:MAG: hypothetical protein BZY82_08255 [SAR202 cluster bacterium Io17-Chloro-G3]|nr:MAG: hypothetical protein BZY82_08255 [SAR202 cluster bacterium Io17-Chloro-G3]